MAVVIGSNLRKELASGLLFDGVSFKVERRERLALSGPNGAGKTTLLRMLAGETGVDGGQLVFDKGTRVALHDQRPPLELGLSLREYALAGARDLVELEEELRRLESAMAAGDLELRRRCARYSEAQARLEHAGGYGWREKSLATLRGLGFAESRARPAAGHVLRRGADARLAGARARRRPGPAAPRRADEPPRRRAAGVARAHARRPRRRGDPRRARPVVPRGDDHGGAGARCRPLDVLPRRVARLAPREGGADARRDEVDRSLRRRHRAAPALRRPVPLQEIEGEAGPGQADADRAAEGGDGRARRRRPRCSRGVPGGSASSSSIRRGAAATSSRSRGCHCARARRQLLDGVSFAIERGEHVALVGPNGSGKTTLIETILGRREVATGSVRLGHGVVPAYFSQHEAELDERGSVLDCVQAMTGLRRPDAQNLLGRFLFSGWETHEKPVKVLSGGERRRLALAVVVASGANLLVLDEPTNHLDLESREALESALENFPATVLLVSHDRALLDCVAERTLAIEDGTIDSYDGGWADYVRAREDRSLTVPGTVKTPQRAESPPTKPRAERPKPQGPSPLEHVESGDRRAGGDRRRARAPARRGLGERRAAGCAHGRARRAPEAARAVGGAVRGGPGA